MTVVQRCRSGTPQTLTQINGHQKWLSVFEKIFAQTKGLTVTKSWRMHLTSWTLTSFILFTTWLQKFLSVSHSFRPSTEISRILTTNHHHVHWKDCCYHWHRSNRCWSVAVHFQEVKGFETGKGVSCAILSLWPGYLSQYIPSESGFSMDYFMESWGGQIPYYRVMPFLLIRLKTVSLTWTSAMSEQVNLIWRVTFGGVDTAVFPRDVSW